MSSRLDSHAPKDGPGPKLHCNKLSVTDRNRTLPL